MTIGYQKRNKSVHKFQYLDFEIQSTEVGVSFYIENEKSGALQTGHMLQLLPCGIVRPIGVCT